MVMHGGLIVAGAVRMVTRFVPRGIQGGCGDASLAKAVGSSVAAGPVQARRAVGIDPVRG